MMVNSLINPITHTWREDKLTKLFDEEFVASIRTPVPYSYKQDTLRWNKDVKGQFSASNVYTIL